MQKLTSKQIIQAIKRNFLILLIPAILLAGLSIYLNFIKGGSYKADAVLIVTSDTDDPITYNKLILNEKLANIYGGFLESEDLYDNVAAKLSDKEDAEQIKDKLEYSVNPQGGLITFTYKDSNELRSKDTLMLITEEFRSYAKKYLSMENIEYLQNIIVKKSSNKRGAIFTGLALIVGAMVGLIFIMIKEILSDRLNDANDIRQLNIEVLADLSKPAKAEYAKVKRKIEGISMENIIGLTPLTFDHMTDKIAEDMAKTLTGAIIDARDERLSLTDLKIEMAELLKSNRNVIFKEKSIDHALSIDLAQYQDYKILIVKSKKTYKNDLISYINECQRLGIRVLGVICY